MLHRWWDKLLLYLVYKLAQLVPSLFISWTQVSNIIGAKIGAMGHSKAKVTKFILVMPRAISEILVTKESHELYEEIGCDGATRNRC